MYEEEVVKKELTSLVTHLGGKLEGHRSGDLFTVGNWQDVSAFGQNGEVRRAREIWFEVLDGVCLFMAMWISHQMLELGWRFEIQPYKIKAVTFHHISKRRSYMRIELWGLSMFRVWEENRDVIRKVRGRLTEYQRKWWKGEFRERKVVRDINP